MYNLVHFSVLALAWSFPVADQKQEHALSSLKSSETGLRPLLLGQVQFLHTTDTHGWLGSHLTQREYDATWGDYISFVQRLKERVGSDDLLLIDTGDKRTGNGLSDATTPPGLYSTDIFNQLDFDLLTLGNHELYDANVTEFEYYSTALNEKFQGKYLSSNVEFITDGGELVPFGEKYRYFTTPNHKYRILSFAFIYDFKRINPRAKVTPLSEEIKKPWFLEVIEKYPPEELDLIVVIGHLPTEAPDNVELLQLHQRLRAFYPTTVIQYFGGHSHIRNIISLDERATALQSGRFCETVGFLSIDGLKSHNPFFARRYIDFNLASFKHHSGVLDKKYLETPKGKAVNGLIDKYNNALGLLKVHGFVPQNYYMYSEPINSTSNVYNLLSTKVLLGLKGNNQDMHKSRLVVINTGSIRFDIYAGDFTTGSEYIVAPFQNQWLYLEVPLGLARRALAIMNSGDYILSAHRTLQGGRSANVDPTTECKPVTDEKLSRGYTTSDDFGCTGDDTPHRSEFTYPIPNVIAAEDLRSDGKDDKEKVDFVFLSFLQSTVLAALNTANHELNLTPHNYSVADVQLYGGNSVTALLREYFSGFSNNKT